MFKFKTFKCACCETVVCNLPYEEAKNMSTHIIYCEDCTYKSIL